MDLERNVETIQVIDQMIDQEMVEMRLARNPTYIVNIVIRWSYLEILWERQANGKNAKRLKEIDDRDDGPSDTFNSMIS